MQKFKGWWLIGWGLVLLAGCARGRPILIGYAGELTGKRGELGVEGRDGAQLAVDHLNAGGGIAGRPVELLVRDDRGDPEIARQVTAELAALDVVAIIGHMTSGQSAAVFEQINRDAVVLISPTSSSNEFNRQEDYFFRVVPDTNHLGRTLARHIRQAHPDVQRLVGICDLSNQTFTESFWNSARAEFQRLGGTAEELLWFTSGETDLQALMAEVASLAPDGIIFVASAVDTALLAQYGRQQGVTSAYFSSGWAQTTELLEKGGHAVEGLELNAVFDPHNPYPTSGAFREQFAARYYREPGFGAVYTYEAVMVLAAALEQTGGQAADLPEALTTIKNFEGVQGVISIDAYGDVERDTYIAVVEAGAFKVLAAYPPEID